jgi:hypothetical protein
MAKPLNRLWILAVTAALGCSTATAKPAAKPAAYVFAWPFLESSIEPRGGTTRGAPVTLETRPSAEWERLHAPGLSARERDRAAILAMAGDYRTSFDFLETIEFTPGAGPARPYRSWGTERIYAIEDRRDFISLQHVLVMFAIDENGKRIGPMVQKHWRQDWRYEPDRVLVFAGNERFETRAVPREDSRGAWSQTVYQVDDSPRYGSVGRWVHADEASIWEGGEAWRPLPRREHSVRSDYQVLAGSNRHTILPTGWVHEQDNLKLVLQVSRSEPKASEDQQIGNTRRLAREIGVDRYERLRDFDFSAADAYWKATASFWALVRQGWAQRVAKAEHLRVATTCEGAEAFVPFFSMAQRIESGEAVSADAQRAEIERALDCVVGAD